MTAAREEEIAELWKGYGKITRRFTADEESSIIKRVDMRALASASLNADTLRKGLSYQIERHLYQQHPTGRVGKAKIAKYIASGPDFLQMEDLLCSFPETKRSIGAADAPCCLTWFAQFHAAHFGESRDGHAPGIPSANEAFVTTIRNQDFSQLKQNGQLDPVSYWRTGSYWHLDTRREEQKNLPRAWRTKYSEAINRLIEEIPQKFQTIVHGDAKAANILFDAESTEVAMYDFQYCGWSSPMRDVAAFLVTSIKGLDEDLHEKLLHHYHGELVQALQEGGSEAAASYSFEIMHAHYDLCLADFHRFMLSWGAWGNHHFAAAYVERWLKRQTFAAS